MSIQINLLMKKSRFMSKAERDELAKQANSRENGMGMKESSYHYNRALIPYGSCSRCTNLDIDEEASEIAYGKDSTCRICRYGDCMTFIDKVDGCACRWSRVITTKEGELDIRCCDKYEDAYGE